ncbi:streptococcal hemagglutinin isoform X1 [Drosophila kikkawai]|uniref:Streptococcal hemagglutinin isoform X1 n=1 Tax=Drosophila kikkawai TaxID=30033 RepID=A0A6P4IQ23_DROKI
MEDIEYLDEYKDLVLPGIKVADGRPSAGARRRRISSDSSNSSSLDADIFQKLFLDKSVDDDLLNISEGAGSKSQSRRHRSPSSSDISNDALDALFNRKIGRSKPNKRRERLSSLDSVDDLGQVLMRSTQRLTVPKPSTSQARVKKSRSDALYRSSSSSNSSARGKSSSRKSKPPVTASSGKGAAVAAPSLTGKYKNPSKPSSVNGSSSASKGKAVTILKAQKTDLKPPKHEPKTDPLNLTEFFDDSDSDSSYTYESDFFDDLDSADDDADPIIDISTDTSRTTSVADTVTPVVSDDDGQEPQREQDEENEQNGRSQSSLMNSVYERLQSYLNNLSCAEAPPIYKKQSFVKKPRSSEKKPTSPPEQVKHAKERSAASGKVQEEKERDQECEPTKAAGSSLSSPAKSAGRSTNSLEEKSSTSASGSRRLFEVDDGLTLETLQRMSQDLAEQILEIDVERSVEYQKRSGSKHRSRSMSKISGEPSRASDLASRHGRKLTYSSDRLDNGCESMGTELRRSRSESAFSKRRRPQGEKQRKTRAATDEDNVLSRAKEGQAGELVKRKRGRPRKKQTIRKSLQKSKSAENVHEPVAKDSDVIVETSGVEAVKEQDLLGEQKATELNSELEKAKEFAGFLSQDDISVSSCHQETDLKNAPDRNSSIEEDAERNLKKNPSSTVYTSTESFDTAMDTSEITESVTQSQDAENKEWVTQPETIQEDHNQSNDATMAIKDLEEIENAIETAGDIAMTPELADALDASSKVAGNMLEESDSQLAEDIKLAEEILAAEVGKGMEVTEEAAATVVGDQNPVIDIVKELEQEIVTEAVGNSEELAPSESPTEVERESGQSPVKGQSPAKGKSPTRGQSPAKGQSSAKSPSPAKGQLSDKEKSPAKGQSPTRSPTKSQSPVKDQSIALGPSLAAEQSLEERQSTESEVQEPSDIEEQSEAKEKRPVIEDQTPTKNSMTEDTEDSLKLNTPNKKTNLSSPAKFKELREAAESLVARRALRSDKPESKQSTPESTPTKQTPRRSRGKLSLRSELTLLKDDSSRRSSPRLGRSPAESHSSQESSQLAKETKSSTVEIESKDKSMTEDSNPVKDVPVTDATLLGEEKPSSDETDAKMVDVKPSRKRGKKKKVMAKPTKEPPHISKLIDEQSTSSESEQKDKPAEVQAGDISELPAEQTKASESKAENIDEKPSSSRKSRSRRSRWDHGKPESNSPIESSEVQREKIQLRTSQRESDSNPETKVDGAAGQDEQISSNIRRGGKLKTEASPTPAKTHSSRARGTTKDKPEGKESSMDKSVKSKSVAKTRKNKFMREQRVDDSTDQPETEPEKALSEASSRKMNPTLESKAVSNSADPDPIAKELREKDLKEKPNNPKETTNTDTEEDVDVETISRTVSNEILPPSKAESAELKDKAGVTGVKRGRIKKRKEAIAVEDSEVDTPSEMVELSTTETADKTQIKTTKKNQSPTLDTEPIPPPAASRESEKEVVASGSQRKSKKNKRKSAAATSASATDSESVSITIPAEPISQNSEPKPEDNKNTSSNSPSNVLLKDNISDEVSNLETKRKTPSSSLPCRKLRVLIKRTPTTNLVTKGKNIRKKGPSSKRKKINKMLESIDECVVPDQPNSESQPVCESPKSDNIPNPVEEEVSKEATEKTTCDGQKDVPKKAIDEVKEKVPKDTAVEEVTDVEEKLENITQEQESTEETTVMQNPENETLKLSRSDDQEDTIEKETHEAEEFHKEEEVHKVEKTCQDEDTSKSKETPDDREIPIDEETPIDQDVEPSEEPLREDCTDPDPTKEPENAPAESTASPTPDPMETETTGVTDVAPEASTKSRGKRGTRKREADSSQSDDAAKKKLVTALKSRIEKRKELFKNLRRRLQPEELEHPAIKRAKADSGTSKPSERGKTISMIGNETIMTSPANEIGSDQPQTSQAAKRTAAATKGGNYAETTKHVIISAPGKKQVDVSPTKKPMVQTLLSSTLNLRKPLPGEDSGSGLPVSGRKSLGKSEVEASKAKSQPTLNSSLVVTKKAVLPASKKSESPTKEDKSTVIAPRKVNISVSLVPSKDSLASTSSLSKSLETSPVLPRKVQLVEAQKTVRKSEAKKKVDPETPAVTALDKNKPKVIPKPTVAVDNTAKKMDAPARKSLPVEVPKKTETRKSEGQSLNSRKAPLKAEAAKKTETRKSEGASLGRKVPLAKESEQQKLESPESEEVAADTPVVAVAKDSETGIAEQRKESSATSRMEKPTVAVTPRTVSIAKSIHMTRAASSSRSLAPTPTPLNQEQQTGSLITLPTTQTLPPNRIRKNGRFARISAATKRKALEAAEASMPKRPKEDQQQQQEEGPDQEHQSLAFPVKITAVGLAQPVPSGSKASLVSQKPIPEVKKPRKLRIRVNRHVVSQWLKDQRKERQELPKRTPAPADDMASDTESAAESMSESINSSCPEPPVAALMPPVPPLVPIRGIVVPPPVVATKKAASTVLAQISVTSAPAALASVQPAPAPPASVKPAPAAPAAVTAAPVTGAPVTPALVTTAPAPPALAPLASTPPLPSVPPTPPAPVPASEPIETLVVPPLNAEKVPKEVIPLEDARRLAALKKVRINTTLPMPLPVPIAVAEVKSEPEDNPPEPMEGDCQEAVPLDGAPPVPQAPLVAEGTPPVMSASTSAEHPVPNEIPSANAAGNTANSFGHTKMFSFLYPNRHSGNYGEVGLDFCCPNLDGPMPAIDPTRLHAKVEAPVLEMPQFLVITTKFISKADKNIPNKVRAKLELLGKDKELSSSERSTTIPDPPALAASASPVPIPQSLPAAPLRQPAAPPMATSSSTRTPAVPASSIDSLTKQLPRGTTLTKKVLPPGAPVPPPTASESMAASLPLSLIQLPILCPADQQRTELQTRVQVFDLVLQALSRRVANLTVAERQRTIEEMVKTSSLMPIDVDVGTKLLENYVHYVNKATSSATVSPLPPPPAIPQPEAVVIRKPVYDMARNVIGFKNVTSPNLKANVATPRRKTAPGSAPAATSTPLAASTSSSAAAAASAGSRFVEIDNKTVKASQRQMITVRKTPQRSAVKGSIIAIKAGAKVRPTNAPVGKAASPANRGPAAGPRPISKTPATRGPAPVKPTATAVSARSVSSVPIVAPNLTRTTNPNVFIINQASHVEESILPDSNNVVAPIGAEIKGELDDSSEAII